MANPKPPPGGFQQGGWYEGRQYWNGTFSEPGQIHPQSNQQGAGTLVSPEVNAQSAAQQGVSPQQLEAYLQKQRQVAPSTPSAPTPSGVKTSSTPKGTTGAGGIGMPTTPTINLPELYKSITKESGIEATQAQLSEKEKAYNDAVSKINDNPFLSEANRVGRIQKLTTDYENSIASLKKDVATKKADIETRLNLESKQFDINSQQAQQALSQFNSLLSMGALDGASGDDIAAITRTTGLSSSMIMAAIDANKAKNVKTETIKWDDGKEQGFAIVNSQTGEIISKQAVAASEPKKSTGGGGLTATQSRAVIASARKAITEADTNTDKALSLQEFQKVIESIMTATGIDQGAAEEYAAQAFTDLGYKTWNWSKK